MNLTKKPPIIAAALAGALLLGACAGGTTGLSTESAAGDSATQAAEGSQNQLPKVDVIDLATGEMVNVASFAPSSTPLVFWFWAPN